MAGSSYRIKLSSAMRPYVGRVVRNGKVQQAFAASIGRTVGACVSSQLKGKTGQVSGGQVKDVVRQCAKAAKGTSLPGTGFRSGRSGITGMGVEWGT